MSHWSHSWYRETCSALIARPPTSPADMTSAPRWTRAASSRVMHAMLRLVTATIEAVVFDLDGVLIDSEPVWEEVRRAFVANHGGSWAPDAQQRLMGMSTPEWASYLSRELGVGDEPDQI